MGPRSGSALPTDSVAKGAAAMRANKKRGERGKRTGIEIDNAEDDMDAMFASAKTPETNHSIRNRKNSSLTGSARGRRTRRMQVASSSASSRPSMGLPGSRRDGDDGDELDVETELSRKPKSSEKKVRYSARAKRNNNKRASFSPSEMSSVSTAPPTPRNPEVEEVDDDDDDDGFDNLMDVNDDDEQEIREQHSPTHIDSSASSTENTDTESREPFPTRRAKEKSEDGVEEDEEVEEDIEVAHGQSNRRIGVQRQEEDDSTDVEQEMESSSKRDDLGEKGDGAVDTEEDDEDRDLLPPNPPEEPSSESDTPTPRTVPKSSEKRSGANNDSDDDEDQEGGGFQFFDGDEEDPNMVHDPETPLSTRKKRADRERQEIEEEANMERKKKKKNKSKGGKRRRNDIDNSSSSEDDDSPTHRKKTPKKKKTRFAPAVSPLGYPIDNRGYELKPIEEFAPKDPSNGNLRRSRRAKFKPLEHWRNERPVYGRNDATGHFAEAYGDMPVVAGIQKALPTPHKKRAVKKEGAKQKKLVEKSKKVSKSASQKDDEDDDEEEEFDYKSLRREGKVIESETACLWDDGADDTNDTKVVAYARDMDSSELPISKSRSREEGKIGGRASQAFNITNEDSENYVGYIMGNLVLPPKGIKDAESVGPCSQTFTVCHGQPRALEVAYGDPDQPEGVLNPETAQRFYLGPGDLFRVPPGNCYRLENLSETKDCILTWTIIRPNQHHSD